MTDGEAHSALIHLYRGELGRMTTYRVRLDTTTNWAVGTSAAVVSFALSQPRVPHTIFGLALALNLIFLWMEARRYRVYALILARVRRLERGFFGRVLGGAESGDWRAELRADIDRPVLPLSQLRAATVRLRRNYIWLVLLVYTGWLVKLGLGGGIVDSARIGHLPGAAVLAAFGGVLAVLVGASCLPDPHDEG